MSGGGASNSHKITDGILTKEEAAIQARRRAWIWWPSVAELKGHYLRELGFLASATQLVAATVFWIAGFTALPGVQNHMSQGLLDGGTFHPFNFNDLLFISRLPCRALILLQSTGHLKSSAGSASSSRARSSCSKHRRNGTFPPSMSSAGILGCGTQSAALDSF